MSIAIPPFGEGKNIKLISQSRIDQENTFYTYDGSADCDSEGNLTQGGRSFRAYRYKDGTGTYWGELLGTSEVFQENGENIYYGMSGFGKYHGWYHEFEVTAPEGANYNILYLPNNFITAALYIGFDFSNVTYETSSNIFDGPTFGIDIKRTYAMVDEENDPWTPINMNDESQYYLDYYTGLYWPPDWAFAMNNITDRDSYSPTLIQMKNHIDYPGRNAQTTNSSVTDKKDNTTKNCNLVTCRTGVNRIVDKKGTTTSMWKNINGYPVEYPALGNWNLGPFIIFKNKVVFRIAIEGYLKGCEMSSAGIQNPKGTLYRGDFTLIGSLHSYKI